MTMKQHYTLLFLITDTQKPKNLSGMRKPETILYHKICQSAACVSAIRYRSNSIAHKYYLLPKWFLVVPSELLSAFFPASKRFEPSKEIFRVKLQNRSFLITNAPFQDRYCHLQFGDTRIKVSFSTFKRFLKNYWNFTLSADLPLIEFLKTEIEAEKKIAKEIAKNIGSENPSISGFQIDTDQREIVLTKKHGNET